METYRVVAPLASRCSGCSRTFQWSASQLFPLLCGHLFCRSCLVQHIHAAFSSRTAPVQCCMKAVPHDFIRAVVAPEEDVYYSFLLGLPRGEEKMTQHQVTMESKPIVITSSNAEAKQPAMSSQGQAAQAPTGTRIRYLTRSARARHAAEQGPKESDVKLSRNPHVFCEKCGIAVDTSPLRAPCGHEWCRVCVKTEVRRFLDASSNTSPMPASCCGQLLSLELVRQVFTGRELLSYAKKKAKHTSAGTDTIVKTRGSKRKAVGEDAAAAPRKVYDTVPAKKLRLKTKINTVPEQKSERICTACLSLVVRPEKWRVGPCGHGYCLSCLAKMAKTSLTSRESVPIRCCKREFPVEYVKKVLTTRQLAKYERFLAERDPNASNLRSDREYAAVVRHSNGKQCPVCGVGVIKAGGCNAILCSLGHSFCWKCMQTRCICGQLFGYD